MSALRGLAALALSAGLIDGAAAAEGTAFLNIPVGARAASLAGAQTAAARGVEALPWNPSGLAGDPSRGVSFSHAEMFGGQRHEAFGYAHPLPSGAALGFSGVVLTQPELDGRDANGAKTGGFRAHDAAFSASFAKPLDGGRRAGVGVKALRSSIGGYTASGFAFDAGLQGATPWPGLTWGAAVRNLGPGMTYLDEASALPLTFAGGASYAVAPTLTLHSEVAHRPHAATTTFAFGTELTVFRGIDLRGGFGRASGAQSGNSPLEGSHLGVGADLGAWRLDFAYTMHGELGGVQRLSVATRF